MRHEIMTKHTSGSLRHHPLHDRLPRRGWNRLLLTITIVVQRGDLAETSDHNTIIMIRSDFLLENCYNGI